MSEEGRGTPYQLFMLVLCVVVLLILGVEAVLDIDEETATVLLCFDTVAAIFFLSDFFYSLYSANNRRRYLLTWGWIDLLSSIPSVAVLRWGRAARVARLFRVLRGARSARFIGAVILRHRAHSAALAATLLALLTALVGSIAVLNVERAAGGNIVTAGDAMWWTMATMSTSGFGDLFPVTGEGRAIGVVLMVVGIGLFGTITGLVAAWIVAEGEKDHRGGSV